MIKRPGSVAGQRARDFNNQLHAEPGVPPPPTEILQFLLDCNVRGPIPRTALYSIL